MANSPVDLGNYKANLSGEYAPPVGRGYRSRFTLSSNWSTTGWGFIGWAVASFASTDGKNHVLFEARKDTSNWIRCTKLSDGTVEFRAKAGGGSEKSFTVSPTAWASGGLHFAQVRFDGSTMYGSFDGMTEGSVGSVGTFAAGTYLCYCGSNAFQYDNWEGYLNLIVHNAGTSSAAATARYNSGNGQNFKDWAYTYYPYLVAYVNGTSSTGNVDTYQGATDALAGTATGRLDLNGTTQYATFGDRTEFDAATRGWLLAEIEPDTLTGSHRIVTRWDSSADTKKQLRLYVNSAGNIAVEIATNLAGGIWTCVTSDTPCAVARRGMVLFRFDLLALTDATRGKIDWALHDATTKKYTWSSRATSYGGTAPAALTTPSSSTNLAVGAEATGGGAPFDGKIDAIRWGVGATFSDADRDAIIVNEANPLKAQHSYNFDGDANDEIGSINGALVGSPSFVDDGRHHSGQFERFTKQGRYLITSTAAGGNKLSTADPGPGADGLTKATWIHWLTIPDASIGPQRVFGRLDGADNQFAQDVSDSTNNSRCFIAAGAADVSNFGMVTDATNLGAGKTVKLVWVFDGTLPAGSRLACYVYLYDPTTGTYGARVTPAVSISGTIPAALTSSALGYTWFLGGGVGSGARAGMMIDETRIWYGVALTAAEADAETIYAAPVKAGISHRWQMNGNGTDDVAGLTATVTGSNIIQWYDGRQPVGWTITGGDAIEVDRATGANQVAGGTFGLRIKRVGAGTTRLDCTSPAVAGSLTLIAGSGRISSASAGDALWQIAGGSIASTQGAIAKQAAMSLGGCAGRPITSVGSMTFSLRANATNGEAYIDSVQAIVFASVSFDVLDWKGAISSANSMFGYPNFVDPDAGGVYTPTFSGGSWRAALPLTKLQNAVTSDVARSTDAANASTKFVLDLKNAWSIRALHIMGHNLSLNGLIRVRCSASSDGVTSPLYDTDWVKAYPEAYPLNTLQTGHPAYSDRMLTAVDWANKRNRYPWTHVIPTNVAARYWSFEFDDTANADGYVELGRLYMAWCYQPNGNFKPGFGLGWQTQTTVYTADDDTPYADEHVNLRQFNLSFDSLDVDESLTFMFDELQRKMGINNQILFIEDPTAIEEMHRTAMACRFGQLTQQSMPYVAQYMDLNAQLVEWP